MAEYSRSLVDATTPAAAFGVLLICAKNLLVEAMAPTAPDTKAFAIDQNFEPGGSEMFGTLGSFAEWQRRTNVWRKATNPWACAKRLRNRTANDGYSDEKMCPTSRKTRIRCPLPQCVERSLVGSCGLFFDSLRGASRAGAIRRPRQT